MKISVNSLGEDKLYVVEAKASRQGRRTARAITVKLDSGAVGESWIEPRLVDELGLRTRDLKPGEQRTYYMVSFFWVIYRHFIQYNLL